MGGGHSIEEFGVSINGSFVFWLAAAQMQVIGKGGHVWLFCALMKDVSVRVLYHPRPKGCADRWYVCPVLYWRRIASGGGGGVGTSWSMVIKVCR